jgi:hypothetical protein
MSMGGEILGHKRRPLFFPPKNGSVLLIHGSAGCAASTTDGVPRKGQKSRSPVSHEKEEKEERPSGTRQFPRCFRNAQRPFLFLCVSGAFRLV